MTPLDDSLIISKTKSTHLWAGDGWVFRHTSLLLKVPLPFFTLLSFKKFSFQIPVVERQGAQPAVSESRVLDLFELGDESEKAEGTLTAEQGDCIGRFGMDGL